MKQQGDKFVIRLPEGLREVIKREADKNERTMNAEVIFHLKRAYGEGRGQGEATA